jgi:hypothetical protein
MADTAHALRADRVRSVEECTARLIPADAIGAYVALLGTRAGEGR